MNTTLHPEIDGLDAELCQSVVERVCASTELRRSARLRDFLQYVSRGIIEHPGVTITEQEIGEKVFGRPADYDTSIDNIVRVNASELRKRIHTYFSVEGKHEPIWFEIPRGSYMPRFTPKRDAVAVETSPEVEPLAAHIGAVAHTGSPVHPTSVRPLAWLAAVTLLLLGTCVWLAVNLRSTQHAMAPWRSEPALNGFWSPLLDGIRATDIVLADTSLVFAQDVLGHRVALKDYLNRSYMEDLDQMNLSPELHSDIAAAMARSDGSLGDFGVVQRVLRMAPGSDRLHLDYARTLRPSALKTDNLILVGSSYSNPWTSLFESNLNFVVTIGQDRRQMFVANQHPIQGEQSSYAAPAGANDSVGYSVIASMEGEEGQGEIVLIEGTTAEATEAAGEFLTSEARLKQLQALMHVNRLRHFEVLLRTTKLAGTPLSAEIIGFRQH